MGGREGGREKKPGNQKQLKLNGNAPANLPGVSPKHPRQNFV